MPAVLGSFFHQPLPVADYWLWLVFPICLALSLVYKTTRAARFRDIFPAALLLFATMIGGFILLTIAIWLITFL
ncbi:MAG: hypothetical protein GWP14_07950 [Actinobacteria bacterium]|nr:hypothetical protein [Actinomycetota bacterium]